MKAAIEFGMTPSARTRMGVRPEPATRGKFGKALLNGK
jgi:hypothetical protein